jgi:Kdo2-lipid IVA lauroyltransferase/acyltransferase
VRTMMRALRQGHAVWYAPDQNYRHKGSLMVDFFGTPAPTNSATSRIAKATGASVVSYYTHRLEDGSGYHLYIQPPLQDFPSDDLADDTRRINALIEDQVRQQPAEYLWVHQRFKPRKRSERDVYSE